MSKNLATLNSVISDFHVATTAGLKTLSNLHGKNVVLFFYPKDNTPVCTSETKAFRDHFQKFNQLNTIIFGVSRDTLASHERVKERLALPFELIADTNEELCAYFNVIDMKKFFGKEIRGIIRSTFLIDAQGKLCHEWRKVKVNGHVDEVLKAIKLL